VNSRGSTPKNSDSTNKIEFPTEFTLAACKGELNLSDCLVMMFYDLLNLYKKVN